ncbi:hypothetical protein OIU84_009111 [Salix udensis]|uniref:Alcohol dehydrogenase-like N-terminal domain-containing protein n=1 Tax=Salix udensis TaxID=889485 RepID=A0AAD6JSL9_9ROSI|nr:hypothetical protein OIU84_009111 [Salix udensis]
MGSLETERKIVGWAATDSTGHLAPYTYSLRDTGPEDVFIKVISCGICHTDIHQIKNDLGMSHYPMVPGHEVVGEVVEVGSDVTKFKVGEVVGVGVIVGSCRNCHPCKSEIEQYCNKRIWSYNDVYTDGKPTQGGFAESMVVDQKFVFITPMVMLGRKSITGSFIGSIKETEEMLEFCKENGLASTIEVIKMDYINTAFERLEKNDVRYRFVVDVAGSKLIP